MTKLHKKLAELKSIPMHMPGHKRNSEKFPQFGDFLGIDITEIDGYDNLHAPDGILKESMQNAAKIFKSENSIYLVGGSTAGILASICAILNEGDRVIMDRSSHKSVYNAVELSGAEPVYIKENTHPVYGIGTGITPGQVMEELEKHPDTALIIITSPSYEGVISDISGICKVAEGYNVPVLVDSAHGAHLGFYKFPKSATECGAGIVVESLHKTLPSLTQTAILHTKDKYLGAVRDMLSVFETSSPSYILMASIDDCIGIIENDELFSAWYENISEFKKNTKSLKNLKVLENDDVFFDYDISKIVILANDSSLLAKKLRENNIEPEMVATGYVICMTGAGDTKATLDALSDVLIKIDGDFSPFTKNALSCPVPKRVMLPKLAKKQPKIHIPIEDASGRIAAEYIWAYPPGIPLTVPGEVIDKDLIRLISDYKESGVTLSGNSTYSDGKILVINT